MQYPIFPLGWRVFPCYAGTKEPLSFQDMGGSWKDLATDDPAQIEYWASMWPGCNWAVHTGPSGLAVLDVDGQAGEDTLFAIQLEHGELPETREHTSPRGGRHLIFAGDIAPTVAKIGPKLDTRGRHSYILIPPSVFEGKPYALSHDWPIQNLPDWIGELAGRNREAVQATGTVQLDSRSAVGRAERLLLDYVARGHVAVQGQGGDDRTYAVCAEVLNLGLSEDKAFELIDTIWNTHCQPAWDAEELRAKIANAGRYAQNETGAWAVPPVRDRISHPALDKLMDENAAQAPRREELARFDWMDEDRFSTMPPPVWLIPDMLTRESIAMLYGPSGHYKSFLALNIAARVAQLGECAFYVAAEGIARMARQDFPAWKLAYGEENPIPFFMQEDMPVATDGMDYRAFADSIKVAAKAAGKPVGIIILDTLNNAMIGLEENSAKDTAVLIQAAKFLKRAFNCVVMLVHHTPKDGSEPRGSSALYAAFDTVMRVNSDEDVKLARIFITKQKTSEKRKLPFCFEGRKVGPGLAFLPIEPKEARLLSADADEFGQKNVVAALNKLNARFPDHYVSTHILLQELVPPIQGELEIDRDTALSRAKRGLTAALKSGRLDIFMKGEGHGRQWGMPAVRVVD